MNKMKHIKVYTKRGDTGETSLIGGTRVPKNHIRIQAIKHANEVNRCFTKMLRQEKVKFNEVLHALYTKLFLSSTNKKYFHIR